MKASRDNEAGATYVTLAEGAVVRTISLSDSVMVDVDASGRPLGVEVLHTPGPPSPGSAPEPGDHAWRPFVPDLRAYADRVRTAALAPVLALHVNNPGPNDWCAGCYESRDEQWPCRTLQAIDPAALRPTAKEQR